MGQACADPGARTSIGTSGNFAPQLVIELVSGLEIIELTNRGNMPICYSVKLEPNYKIC